MMEKLLFVTTTLTGGGAERVLSIWASDLANCDFDVHVLVMVRRPNEYYIDPKIDVISIRDSYLDYSQLSFVHKIRSIRERIKSIRPDILIPFLSQNQLKVFLATRGMRGIKRIETVRNNPWVLYDKGLFKKLVWKHIFNSASGIIVQCEEQKTYFSVKNQEKCIVIPNPTRSCADDKIKTEFDNHSLNIIAVGRISKQKNYKLLVESFAFVLEEFPKSTLTIFGHCEKDYYEELKNLIEARQIGDNIFIKGRCDDILSVYKNYDVYVLSSLYEGMPNALIEAMMCGNVCISSNYDGIEDVIENGENGLLVELDDYAGLANTIIDLLENDRKRERLGSNAMACSSKYSKQEVLTLWEKEIVTMMDDSIKLMRGRGWSPGYLL